MSEQTYQESPKFASRYCSECGLYKVIFAEDGVCATCADGPQVDESRLREARRVLYANTARLLHGMGQHAEAAWHEGRAK